MARKPSPQMVANFQTIAARWPSMKPIADHAVKSRRDMRVQAQLIAFDIFMPEETRLLAYACLQEMDRRPWKKLYLPLAEYMALCFPNAVERQRTLPSCPHCKCAIRCLKSGWRHCENCDYEAPRETLGDG